MSQLISPDALQALEQAIEHAFRGGDAGALNVLGYGEISSVVAWPGERGQVACKRLPPFAGEAQYLAYQDCLTQYLSRLRERGVDALTTELHKLTKPDGRIVGVCVQPVLDPESLGPQVFARQPERAPAVFAALLDRVFACVDQGLGLDAQLSNWSVDHDAIRYIDVTTPLMRDAQGREQLDTALFMSSLPWALRPLVKRFMLRGILDKYYEPRGAILDYLGNLYKERLDHLLPALVDMANERLAEPLSQHEIRRYYRGDARTWRLLQRLRRMDRLWQLKVRRRAYPFLLPGPIHR